MKRSEAREQAFWALFEQAVVGGTGEEIMSAAAEARDLKPNAFTRREVLGVEANQAAIDEMIGRHIRGWSLNRLSKVTLALLRLAVYEIVYDREIPESVSINEAVELAKKYGGQDDAAYLNGVLSSVVRERAPAQGEG